jgi:hypothetical protein
MDWILFSRVKERISNACDFAENRSRLRAHLAGGLSMLIISLVLSGALLLVANIVARMTGRLATSFIVCGLVALLCAPFPAFMLTGVLTALSGLLCRVIGGGPPIFLKCSLAAVVASHLFFGILSYSAIQERRILRERFPAESLEQRLSYEALRGTARAPEILVGNGFPPVADKPQAPVSMNLTSLEDQIDELSSLRKYSLMRLHEESVTDFINSPGFGISRQPEVRKKYIELPEADPIPLPPAAQQAKASATTYALPESPADALLIVPEDEDLRALQQESIIDFVNPKYCPALKGVEIDS